VQPAGVVVPPVPVIPPVAVVPSVARVRAAACVGAVLFRRYQTRLGCRCPHLVQGSRPSQTRRPLRLPPPLPEFPPLLGRRIRCTVSAAAWCTAFRAGSGPHFAIPPPLASGLPLPVVPAPPVVEPARSGDSPSGGHQAARCGRGVSVAVVGLGRGCLRAGTADEKPADKQQTGALQKAAPAGMGGR